MAIDFFLDSIGRKLNEKAIAYSEDHFDLPEGNTAWIKCPELTSGTTKP